MSNDQIAAMERLKDKAPQAAELLRQLANANRLLILCHIAAEERSVGQLEADLGIKQPALSQQLAELRQYGLVKTRRQSRSIYYSIADDRAQAVMGMLYEIFCGDGKAVAARTQHSAGTLAGAPDANARPRGDAAQFARVMPAARR
jgi:DNA-binding transcriptional ArsR family regulator